MECQQSAVHRTVFCAAPSVIGTQDAGVVHSLRNSQCIAFVIGCGLVIVVDLLAVYLDRPARFIRNAGHHDLTIGSLNGSLHLVAGEFCNIPLIALQGLDVCLVSCNI